MPGSDLPSSSGSSPPPRTPAPRRAKRKHGDGDDDSPGPAPPSLPSRETRSSAAAREAMAGSVRMARSALWAVRRAASGALWAAKTGSGRGLGLGVERMREVILGVRLVRSVPLPNDVAYSLYPKESVRIGVQYQASVPEWKNVPSEKEAADYRAATLKKAGKIVRHISATNNPEKMRKKKVDKCNCSRPGSEKCVRVHITKARVWIEDQLGKRAFKNCGLDAMGDQAVDLLTAVDKKNFKDVGKSIFQNKRQNFMKTALKEFGEKKTKDLAKYYYNVFLPKRLARLTRAAAHKKDEAVDTADENSGLEDDNNEHRPRKKRKISGSPSTRKKKDLTSGPTVSSQRRKN